jgi:glycosyltransferase involved in cell wall biosynthesis
MNRPVSLVMVVPQGLTVTGVTTWALSLTDALAARGERTGLVVHGCAPGFAEMTAAINPAVRVYRPTGLPPIERAHGDLEAFARAYAEAAADCAGPDGIACLAPMRHGDCFAAAVLAARVLGDRARVIGWQQNDSAYEDAIVAQFEPAFDALVGVSKRIAHRMRERFPHRASDIHRIWNAVRVPEACPERPSMGAHPVRLLYTGRIEHEQKRVLALVAMSDALHRAGCDHRLMVMGDGPALGAVQRLAAMREGRVAAPGAAGSREDVAGALRDAEILVMASRMEGLSFSMVEAMAQGCAIVSTRTESGAGEAVVHGETGVLVDAPDDADDAAVGAALASGVAEALRIGVGTLGAAAWKRARDHFDLDAQADATMRVMRACAAAPGRHWPVDRPCAFSSVPRDGAERLGAALDRLRDRRIAIHGAGSHTHGLIGVLRAHAERIVAFTDDNPASWGFRILDRPVIAPDEAAALGVTDVVLSSWIHEDTVWHRRSVYDRQGVRVHRVYTQTDTSDAPHRGDRPVVVSVHGPDVTSGVTTWSARMCDRTDGACRWRMMVVGERDAIAEARSRWPGRMRGHAHFVAWDAAASATDRVELVRRALADMGADAVVGNYVPEAYAGGALAGIATIGVAHAQHEWYREVLGRAAGAMHTWWPVSAGAHQRVERTLAGVRCGGVIPCGVPVGSTVHAPSDTAHPIRLVYAGRLENVEKRVMDLVGLADALHRRGVAFEMRIVGDGPAESMVRSSAGVHIDAGRITMVGAVGADRMAEQFAWADAVVLVSAREGMPVVVMESLAAGRPVLITEGCGDAVAVVRECGCGAVVPVGAVDAMAEVVAAWSRDRTSLRAMGARGVQAAQERFAIAATGRAADSVVLDAIAQARSSPIDPHTRWDSVAALVELVGDASESELRVLARAMQGAVEHGASLPMSLPGLWRMEERVVREALDRARRAGLTRLAIFPAGRHSARLGRALADVGEVVAMIDESPGADREMHGRAIVTPHAALAMGIDGVIVSSDQHEAALAAKARAWGVPVLTLYAEPETLTTPASRA